MTRNRGRARLIAGGLAFASLASFSRAAEATPSARLVYSRGQSASSCPDEAALRKAVAARIGYDPFFGWAKKTVVVRMVTADGPGYVASVDLVDDKGFEHGARQIRTEGKCAELRDPVALAIAIALDPSILAQQRSATPPGKGTAEPAPEATPPSVDPRPANQARAPRAPVAPAPLAPAPPATAAEPEQANGPADPEPRWEPEVVAALVGSIGVAPAPAVGLSLGFGLRRGWWSVGVEGRADLAASEPAPRGEHVSTSLVVGTLAPCWIMGLVRVCGLTQAGEMSASSNTSEAHIPWLAFGGRFAVTVPFDALRSIRLRSDVLGDVNPPQLSLAGVTKPIWSAPAVAASFAVEGTIQF